MDGAIYQIYRKSFQWINFNVFQLIDHYIIY